MGAVMSAGSPRPLVLFGDQIVPWDDDGYPMVFWSKGFAKLCAQCATEKLIQGLRVVPYYAAKVDAQCSACMLIIEANEGEDDGDGDCDWEQSEEIEQCAPINQRSRKGFCYDPTNTDWEDWFPEDDVSCDLEDCGDSEPNDWDLEESPPTVQVDWLHFEPDNGLVPAGTTMAMIRMLEADPAVAVRSGILLDLFETLEEEPMRLPPNFTPELPALVGLFADPPTLTAGTIDKPRGWRWVAKAEGGVWTADWRPSSGSLQGQFDLWYRPQGLGYDGGAGEVRASKPMSGRGTPSDVLVRADALIRPHWVAGAK